MTRFNRGARLDHEAGQHEGFAVDECIHCATRPPFVTVQVSRELLAQMTQGWSPPVQVRIEPPAVAGGHHEMVARTHECSPDDALIHSPLRCYGATGE